MDEFVENTLTKWNLGELVERFRDEEVNEEAFMLLTPDIIKELIPKLGKRAIFNARYAELKKICEEPLQRDVQNVPATEQPVITIAATNIPQPVVLNPTPICLRSATSPVTYSIGTLNPPSDNSANKKQENEKGFEKYFLEQLSTLSQAPSSSGIEVETIDDDTAIDIDEEPFLKKIKLEKLEGEELADATFLEESQDSTGVYEDADIFTNTDEGSVITTGTDRLRALLAESPATRDLVGLTELDKRQRTQLTNALVYYMITISPNGKVSSKSFRYWAKAIELLFPSEKARTYYRYRDREGSNGKLQERYSYLSRTKRLELAKLREQHVYAVATAEEASSPQGDDSCEDFDNTESAEDNQSPVDPTGGNDPTEQQAIEQLKRILTSCFMIKDSLRAKFLTPNQRNILAANIVNYLMEKNGGPISLEEMDCYAKAIEKLFPQENASIYFRRASNRSRVNGKIFDRYGYMKRKKSAARGKRFSDFLDSRTPIGQLREIKTIEDARYLWSETYKARKEYTRKFQPIQMFEMFPFLTLPDGYTMFLEDFNKDYPDAIDSFKRYWPEYATNIYRYIGEINFLESVTEFSSVDYQTDILTSMLIILPLLFKLSKRSERHWSPTRLDVAHNFVMYAQEFKQAIDYLRHRQEIFDRYRLKLTPVVVAIGPTISNIESCYVVINHVFYKFATLPEAVEVCIKIFATMSLKYLDEAVSPWLFLQRFVMKLELPTDNITTKIFSVLEAMNMPLR